MLTRAGAIDPPLRRAAARVTFDDPTRADLTRETKQVLSYAAVGERARRRARRVRSPRALRRRGARGRRRRARAVRSRPRRRRARRALEPRGALDARGASSRSTRMPARGTPPRRVRRAAAARALRGLSRLRRRRASAKASSRSTTSRASKTPRSFAGLIPLLRRALPERAVDPHDGVDAARARVRRRARSSRCGERRASASSSAKACCTSDARLGLSGASPQWAPLPTSTSSGTSSVNALSIASLIALLGLGDARLRHLEDELVVHREDHARARHDVAVAELDHRELQDVGRRALDRRVLRDALGLEAEAAVRASGGSGRKRRRPRSVRTASPLRARRRRVCSMKRAHAGEALEVRRDEARRLLRA